MLRMFMSKLMLSMNTSNPDRASEPIIQQAEVAAWLERMKHAVMTISNDVDVMTSLIVQDLQYSNEDEEVRKFVIFEWVQWLSHAGVQNIRYTRTFAIIAHSILSEPMPRYMHEALVRYLGDYGIRSFRWTTASVRLVTF